MSAIGEAGQQQLRLKPPRHSARHDHGPERQMCAGETLGETHQIRPSLFAEALPREPLATAAKAAHDFIGDQIDRALLRHPPQGGPVAVGRHDAVGAGVRLHHHRRNRRCAPLIDRPADAIGRRFAAGAVRAGAEGAAIEVRWRHVDRAKSRRIGLCRGARIARQRHGRVARAMVGAIARDDPALRHAARLARELDRVLVGVSAAEGEVHASVQESGFLEQQLRQPRARRGAPGTGDEAKLLRLRPDRLDDTRMLMSEVAALGQAAEIQDRAAIGGVQPGAGATDDGRCVPFGLPAPAVQYRVCLGAHGTCFNGLARAHHCIRPHVLRKGQEASTLIP